VDLAAERATGDFVRAQILSRAVTACHDVADGGLLVALAEMALEGDTGITLDAAPALPAHAFWYGEDQGRYVLAAPDAAALLAAAQAAGIPARRLGRSGGGDLVLPDGGSISLATLRDAHERFLPTLMAQAGG
jgi:phosphoribosylformylglycinamidine synthase